MLQDLFSCYGSYSKIAFYSYPYKEFEYGSFSPKEENGNGDPAPKKPCMEQNLELSYADRAKLPSMYHSVKLS